MEQDRPNLLDTLGWNELLQCRSETGVELRYAAPDSPREIPQPFTIEFGGREGIISFGHMEWSFYCVKLGIRESM
jgi:hypothetical protein